MDKIKKPTLSSIDSSVAPDSAIRRPINHGRAASKMSVKDKLDVSINKQMRSYDITLDHRYTPKV